jgi:hypothetical protein
LAADAPRLLGRAEAVALVARQIGGVGHADRFAESLPAAADKLHYLDEPDR